MHAAKIFFLATVLIASAALAVAQQSPPLMMADRQGDDMALDDSAPAGRGNKLDEKKREDVLKKIEAVRIWRLTEELKLDQATAAKLSAFLSSFDQQRKTVLREQVTTMRDLRRAVNTSKPDEAKLRATLEKLEKNQYAMQGLKEKEFNGLKEILTTEQQARFALFQEKFRHEMRKMLEGARAAGGQGRPENR
jgi:Spy/CpxP family protein refolding chaperone